MATNVNEDGLTHDQLQAACWRRAQQLYHPFMTQRLYCIPNDMHAGNVARWKQYEALGVTPGVWDMVLHWFEQIEVVQGFNSVDKILPSTHWFEFKVGSDWLSDKQKQFQQRMLKIGHNFWIVQNESQFFNALETIIKPTLDIAKIIWKEEYEANGKKQPIKSK